MRATYVPFGGPMAELSDRDAQRRRLLERIYDLTNGEMFWDHEANDFDADRTTALDLRAFAGCFDEQPRYVDMRWARTEENVTSTALASVKGVSRSRRLKLPPERDGDEGESLHATVPTASAAATAKADQCCIRSSRTRGWCKGIATASSADRRYRDARS